MSPLDYYLTQCKAGNLTEDPEQVQVLSQLNKVYAALLGEYKKRFTFRKFFHKPSLVRGMYIWGGVGIGKTFLLDCFFHTLPFPHKLRLHFHQLMQQIHEKLQSHQGVIDPLPIIAKELAKKFIVICIDEFFVADITDAMLLGRLLKALFAEGVSIVTTSNIAPDDLYKNGLQRLQFLPAIDLIKRNLEIIHIPTIVDYRLRYFKEAGVFYTPLDKKAEENMEKTFQVLTHGNHIDNTPLLINNRLINIKKKANDVVWFDFKTICSIPRSQNDYLILAQRFKTIFISNIPIIPMNATDTICLFISLIDVLYDARVKLVISAADSIPKLYNRGYMILEYKRTHSRLIEMQSIEYFLG